MTRGRALPLAAAFLALAVALGACGKRGGLRAPDDATDAYTYPRAYPNPATVLPSGLPSGRPAGEPAATPGTREVLPGDRDDSPFSDPRRKTTYGNPDAP